MDQTSLQNGVWGINIYENELISTQFGFLHNLRSTLAQLVKLAKLHQLVQLVQLAQLDNFLKLI